MTGSIPNYNRIPFITYPGAFQLLQGVGLLLRLHLQQTEEEEEKNQ